MPPSSFGYSSLIARPMTSAAADPEPSAARMSVTPNGASVADTSTAGARSMLDLKGSPSSWYVLLTLAAMALARSGGFIRGRQ